MQKGHYFIDFCDSICDLFRIKEITFAQQYNWLDIAFFSHNNISFKSPEIKIGVQRLDNKCDINIGANQLKIYFFPGVFLLSSDFLGNTLWIIENVFSS